MVDVWDIFKIMFVQDYQLEYLYIVYLYNLGFLNIIMLEFWGWVVGEVLRGSFCKVNVLKELDSSCLGFYDLVLKVIYLYIFLYLKIEVRGL